jgi:hypothetical protein
MVGAPGAFPVVQTVLTAWGGFSLQVKTACDGQPTVIQGYTLRATYGRLAWAGVEADGLEQPDLNAIAVVAVQKPIGVLQANHTQ